ncbi:MAG: elongation factor P [Desulfovibrio sp.]|nr:MAG: elongation factor P [Desulfovibrio sp.]
MFSTTDFKKGLKIEIDATPYEIIESQHYKPGKGGAMVRTKLRNMLNNRVVDKTFRSGEKVGKADMETRTMQFLYREGDDTYVFMDMTTYEQMSVPEESTGGKGGYLKDGQEAKVLLYNGSPLDIDIPASVVLEVVSTEAGVKGDTVSSTLKPAKLETGITIQVPLFINEGEMVKVDTRSGDYLGRE